MIFCMATHAWSTRVVLPHWVGPKNSNCLPIGMPPPKALSMAMLPVETHFWSSMIEPSGPTFRPFFLDLANTASRSARGLAVAMGDLSDHRGLDALK